jgi:hypothetical protein
VASGDKEHKMLFDLRSGRRGRMIKVVYAILAVLMGTSLFLTVGPLNIGELFTDSGSAGSAAEPYEEQAQRLEAKLRKDPSDEKLLLSLTRAQVSAGNSLLSLEPSEEDFIRGLQQYQQASNTWSEYLEAAKEPNAGTAQLMATALLSLAERSRTYQQAATNIGAATQAQRIVARQRPTLNAFTTLALYTYFTGDYAAAEKAEAEAVELAGEKARQEEVKKQLAGVKQRAVEFQQELKQAEAANRAAAKGNGGTPESLQSPTGPLSGAFGGGGLSE